MRRHLQCFLLIVLVLSVGANAQTSAKSISDSGNRYLDVCSSFDKPTDKWNEMDFLNSGICQGFMLGVRDGVGFSISMLQRNNPSLASLKGSLEDFGVCFPDEVEMLQVIRVTLKYIREHPEQAHLPSASLIFMAETGAFPCVSGPTLKPAQKP
jgi:hypothetical protein